MSIVTAKPLLRYYFAISLRKSCLLRSDYLCGHNMAQYIFFQFHHLPAYDKSRNIIVEICQNDNRQQADAAKYIDIITSKYVTKREPSKC